MSEIFMEQLTAVANVVLAALAIVTVACQRRWSGSCRPRPNGMWWSQMRSPAEGRVQRQGLHGQHHFHRRRREQDGARATRSA